MTETTNRTMAKFCHYWLNFCFKGLVYLNFLIVELLSDMGNLEILGLPQDLYGHDMAVNRIWDYNSISCCNRQCIVELTLKIGNKLLFMKSFLYPLYSLIFTYSSYFFSSNSVPIDLNVESGVDKNQSSVYHKKF